MPPIRCPRCALLNPMGAVVCDCGHQFEPGSEELAELKKRSQRGRRSARRSAYVVGVGLLIVMAWIVVIAFSLGTISRPGW